MPWNWCQFRVSKATWAYFIYHILRNLRIAQLYLIGVVRVDSIQKIWAERIGIFSSVVSPKFQTKGKKEYVEYILKIKKLFSLGYKHKSKYG